MKQKAGKKTKGGMGEGLIWRIKTERERDRDGNEVCGRNEKRVREIKRKDGEIERARERHQLKCYRDVWVCVRTHICSHAERARERASLSAS